MTVKLILPDASKLSPQYFCSPHGSHHKTISEIVIVNHKGVVDNAALGASWLGHITAVNDGRRWELSRPLSLGKWQKWQTLVTQGPTRRSAVMSDSYLRLLR